MSHDWLRKKEKAVAEEPARKEKDGAYIIYEPWNPGYKKLITTFKNFCNEIHIIGSALNAFSNPMLLRRFDLNDEELPAVVIVNNGVSEKYPNIDIHVNDLVKILGRRL